MTMFKLKDKVINWFMCLYSEGVYDNLRKVRHASPNVENQNKATVNACSQ